MTQFLAVPVGVGVSDALGRCYANRQAIELLGKGLFLP